jgi:NDP-sugar pyrophosphorylase family protein
MAGAGSRFSQAGYLKPKPFIDVCGQPMIVKVLENLKLKNANYHLIARNEHIDNEKELVSKIIREYDVNFISIDSLTQGTACTVLFARKFINNEYPLLIANSDQLIDFSVNDYVNDCLNRGLDGSILTFVDEHKDPKWSYAKINDAGLVVEVREKSPISNNATAGLYLFSRGKNFVDAAVDMIINQDLVNNEYYTCPTYNYLIRDQMKIGIYPIKQEQMHGLGTPDDLNKYINFFLSDFFPSK